MFLGSERFVTFALGDVPCEVGRSSKCNLVLPLPDISRLHAVITPRGRWAEVEDRSRHGIAVNGKKTRTARLNPDMDTVVWSNGADMSPDFLYEIGQPVKPQRRVAHSVAESRAKYRAKR